jgi:hypothetical protein
MDQFTIILCPNGHKLRVPADRGELRVKCPLCPDPFDWPSRSTSNADAGVEASKPNSHPASQQPAPVADDATVIQVMTAVIEFICQEQPQPSAWELLEYLDQKIGPKARWGVEDALSRLLNDRTVPAAVRHFVQDLLDSDDFAGAMRGKVKPGRDIESSIDSLLRASTAYTSSKSFQEMVSFMANFRDYAPFNNLLVRTQNPSCSCYATEPDWRSRFGRKLKEDARPMIILAPMHPVMLVYDLDQTVGPPLPQGLQSFARFEGDWDPYRLQRTIENAAEHDRIRVDFKHLSSTNAGFATMARGDATSKMRIAIHAHLDPPSRYGVLCHELAHIYLGHLGGDSDGWWPSRGNLKLHSVEIEAEAVAYIVTRRAGLNGTSPEYVSQHLDHLRPTKLPPVSFDLIAKVAARIEDMATGRLGVRPVRKQRTGKNPAGQRRDQVIT